MSIWILAQRRDSEKAEQRWTSTGSSQTRGVRQTDDSKFVPVLASRGLPSLMPLPLPAEASRRQDGRKRLCGSGRAGRDPRSSQPPTANGGILGGYKIAGQKGDARAVFEQARVAEASECEAVFVMRNLLVRPCGVVLATACDEERADHFASKRRVRQHLRDVPRQHQWHRFDVVI
jgi:hypothetical protein